MRTESCFPSTEHKTTARCEEVCWQPGTESDKAQANQLAGRGAHGGRSKEDVQSKITRVDNTSMQFMKHAAKKCRKLKSGWICFSPESKSKLPRMITELTGSKQRRKPLCHSRACTLAIYCWHQLKVHHSFPRTQGHSFTKPCVGAQCSQYRLNKGCSNQLMATLTTQDDRQNLGSAQAS